MNRSIAPFLLMAFLSALAFGACSSADSENSGSAATDTAARTAKGQTGTDPAVVGEGSTVRLGPGSAIGLVTEVSGTPLPQGASVDYSGGSHDAPNFAWKSAAGQAGSLKDYRGKVVMLNFWGTWCPPCRRELPDIVRLRDDLAPKGFEVIGVAIGERPPAGVAVEDHLATFAGNNDLRYPLIIGNNEMITHYGGISAVPTTFIINKEGKVVSMLLGGMSEAQFRNVVEAVM